MTPSCCHATHTLVESGAAHRWSAVRWLLKQIQAKTDTRSQVELVRILVGQVAPIATGG